MSWFRGKSKEPEKTVSAPESFVSDSSSLSSFEGPTNFASDSRGSTLGGGSGAGGGGSLAELQVSFPLHAFVPAFMLIHTAKLAVRTCVISGTKHSDDMQLTPR